MASSQPGTVLIAEDEPDLCNLLLALIGDSGYHVDRVFDAPSVLNRLEDGGICLVLMDLVIPGQNGLSVIRQAVAQGASVPIIAMSASDLHLAAAKAAGAADTLAKPFDVDELLAVVARYCAPADVCQAAR